MGDNIGDYSMTPANSICCRGPSMSWSSDTRTMAPLWIRNRAASSRPAATRFFSTRAPFMPPRASAARPHIRPLGTSENNRISSTRSLTRNQTTRRRCRAWHRRRCQGRVFASSDLRTQIMIQFRGLISRFVALAQTRHGSRVRCRALKPPRDGRRRESPARAHAERSAPPRHDQHRRH